MRHVIIIDVTARDVLDEETSEVITGMSDIERATKLLELKDGLERQFRPIFGGIAPTINVDVRFEEAADDNV